MCKAAALDQELDGPVAREGKNKMLKNQRNTTGSATRMGYDGGGNYCGRSGAWKAAPL